MGPEGYKHFHVEQGEVFCLRAPNEPNLEDPEDDCYGCRVREMCEWEEDKVQLDPIPNSRRGIGYEERPFLILRLKEGVTMEEHVPKELWGHPYADKAQYEYNLHWLLANWKTDTFIVVKGQFRLYLPVEEFESSPYAEFFDIHDTYVPKHHLLSLDLSAIEPRLSALASREPAWVEVFKGTPKVIYREIRLGPEDE